MGSEGRRGERERVKRKSGRRRKRGEEGERGAFQRETKRRRQREMSLGVFLGRYQVLFNTCWVLLEERRDRRDRRGEERRGEMQLI